MTDSSSEAALVEAVYAALAKPYTLRIIGCEPGSRVGVYYSDTHEALFVGRVHKSVLSIKHGHGPEEGPVSMSIRVRHADYYCQQEWGLIGDQTYAIRQLRDQLYE